MLRAESSGCNDGNVGQCTAIYDNVRQYRAIYGNVWQFTALSGNIQVAMFGNVESRV